MFLSQVKFSLAVTPVTNEGMVHCLQMEEAKVKISEVTGDRVDNKTKLEIIQKEEEAIREEIEEKVKLEEQAEKQKQVCGTGM